MHETGGEGLDANFPRGVIGEQPGPLTASNTIHEICLGCLATARQYGQTFQYQNPQILSLSLNDSRLLELISLSDFGLV